MKQGKKKCNIDLSKWNLEEVYSDKWLEKRIIDKAAWVVEYVINDKGAWGFYYGFESPYDKDKHPLTLRIDFPALNEDGDVYTEANIRDFVNWSCLADTTDTDTRNSYIEVVKELRLLADEIDDLIK